MSRVWLFCDPMNCSLPSSSIHGVFQARILEWVASSFSRGSSWPNDRISFSCREFAGKFFTTKPPGKSPKSTIFQLKKNRHMCSHTVSVRNLGKAYLSGPGSEVSSRCWPWAAGIWRLNWSWTGPSMMAHSNIAVSWRPKFLAMLASAWMPLWHRSWLPPEWVIKERD